MGGLRIGCEESTPLTGAVRCVQSGRSLTVPDACRGPLAKVSATSQAECDATSQAECDATSQAGCDSSGGM